MASTNSLTDPDTLPKAQVATAPAGRSILGSLAEFVRFCRANPRWTVCMVLVVLIWTTELFLVQYLTLRSPNSVGQRFAFLAPKIRFVVDLLFVGSLCLALRPRWLYAAMVVAFLAHLGLITYFLHFGRPISLLTIINQWSEGLAVSDAAAEVLPRGTALLLLGVLAVKITLVALSGRVRPTRAAVWSAAGLFLAGYFALSAATTFVDPLHFVTSTRGVGRLGIIRGYLGPWFAEWYYMSNSELLRRAVERRQDVRDHLTPIEAEIPIHNRLAIIQVESLDTNALGFEVEGVEVTPFLNELRKKSMYFRVKASHDFGSSDADFALLNGVLGSPDVNTWLLRSYPFENTTPQILSSSGFKTTVFHGNSGDFYGRRMPFEKLGFDSIYFREDFDRVHKLPTNSMGVTDAAVFRFSADQLKNCTDPVCHFIITLTTHAPYAGLSPEEEEIYPNPSSMNQRYINNLRYIDNCLREYVTALGPGTSVFLYADHPTEWATGFNCDHDRETDEEYVPCLIYDSDQDLSLVQKTRNDPRATDGTWHLVDVVNYVRNRIKQSHAGPQAAETSKAPPVVESPREEAALAP